MSAPPEDENERADSGKPAQDSQDKPSTELLADVLAQSIRRGGLFSIPKNFIEQIHTHRLLYPRPGDPTSIN
jgi:hypothetical protein